MSVLQIYIPEANLSGDGDPSLSWSLRQTKEGIARSGKSVPDKIPKATRCELILAAGAVLLTQVKLPPAGRQKLRQLLPFAVEDKIFSDPETVHVAAGMRRADGITPVAVVEKNWFAEVLAKLRATGLQPDAALAETCLPDLEPGIWCVVWNGHDGFVRTGESSGMVLDAGILTAPPVGLERALQEAKASGSGPERIVVRASGQQAVAAPVERWSEALGVPVVHGAAWDWTSPQRHAGSPVNLLQGDFAPASGVEDLLPRLKPVLLFAALIVGLQGLAMSVDWWLLKRESRQLQAEMESSFRALFPEAKNVTDPALQMKRKLGELKRAQGASDPNDFLPLLSHSALGAKVEAARIKMLSYDPGGLKMDLALPDKNAADRLAERLGKPGVKVKVDSVSPKAGSVEARISVSAANP